MYLKLVKGLSYTYKNIRFEPDKARKVNDNDGRYLLDTGKFKEEHMKSEDGTVQDHEENVEEKQQDKKNTGYSKQKAKSKVDVKSKETDDMQETVPAYE